MTPSNLDLARECGATYDHQWVDEYVVAGLRFTPLQLDAFAERIRADAIAEYAAMTEKGAKAWADVPGATAWVDELRGNAPVQPAALPAGMPEPVASVYTMEALVQGGSPKCHVSLLQPLAAGTKLYTAAQVQAMLAAHVPVAAFDRKPLADEQVNKYAKVGAIRTEPDGKVWRYAIQYKQELERRYVKGFRDAERAHGIKAQQGVSA